MCLLLTSLTSRSGAEPHLGAHDDDDEVFESVFHRPRGAARAPVLLVVDGVPASTVVLEVPAGGGSPSAPASLILAALSRTLSRDAARRIEVRDERVTVASLCAAGLSAQYDPQRLELQIGIPAALTTRTTHELGSGTPAEAAGALAPSATSGYLNLRTGAGGRWASDHRETADANAHLGAESAINVGGWVLEARGEIARVAGEASLSLRRGDIVGSHDVPHQALRYLAGDFAVPAAGMQLSYPVLGVGVVRNFALRPYRVVQPVGSFDFVLERAATVTVLVNGAPVQRLDLAAGRHDIRDLPLAAGVNDVELVIRDVTGVERRLSFETANPNELLAPGVVQFSFGVGFPLLSDLGLRTYDFSRPILSARRRWGASQVITVGGSLDASVERQRAGAEVAIATTFGSVSADTSASCDRDVGCGHAETLRYDYTRVARGRAHTFAIVGHHRSTDFRDMSPVDSLERDRDDLAVSTSLVLPRRTTGQLGVRYARGDRAADAQEASLGLNRTFGALAMSLLVSTRHDGITRPENRVFLSAQWMLPDRHGAVHAVSHATTSGGVSSEVTYTTVGRPPPGGLTSSVTVREAANEVGAAGSADYAGDRFVAGLSAATSIDRARGDVVETASAEVSTAIAFAGGRAGWSRPITGSFAIIDRNATLAGVHLDVNPAFGGRAAVSDRFGPAVVPNLEPYRVNQITLDAPHLPIGASLGPARYVLLPSYKSGTLIQVGEEGTVFLRGVLVGTDHQPLSFAIAELASVTHDSRPVIPVMTNRAGRFSAVGLVPGRYTLRLPGSQARAYELTVPAGFTGVYSAGTIVLGVATERSARVVPPTPVAAPTPVATAKLATFPAESARFPAAAKALTTALAAARVDGVAETRPSPISLELVQLSIECADPTDACYGAVARSLAADRLLFGKVTPGARSDVKVTIMLTTTDGSPVRSLEQVFANETEAAAGIAALVQRIVQP